MEKSYSLENPWSFSFRGIFLIILGLFSITNKPNSLEPLLLILSLLFLFTSFMKVAETLILKKHPLKGGRLFRLTTEVLSFILLLIGFFFYYNSTVTIDTARDYAITLILVVFVISLIRIALDLFTHFNNNPQYSLILLIECILMLLLVIYFYQIYVELESFNATGDVHDIIHNLEMFGYFSIGFGLIEIARHRLMIRLRIE